MKRTIEVTLKVEYEVDQDGTHIESVRLDNDEIKRDFVRSSPTSVASVHFIIPECLLLEEARHAYAADEALSHENWQQRSFRESTRFLREAGVL